MSGQGLPSASRRKAVRALKKAGFEEVPRRGKGSHVALVKPGWPKLVIVPDRKDIPPGTMRSIIDDAGLSVAEFLKYL